jgi:hypothetical protein
MPIQGPVLREKAEERPLKLNTEFTSSTVGLIDSENMQGLATLGTAKFYFKFS